MKIEGIVNRIWVDTTQSPAVVNLMLQGDKTVYRMFVTEVSESSVGLTKPGDRLEVYLQDSWNHPSASQWNNQTLHADKG